MGVLLIRSQAGWAHLGAPADVADHQHVRVIPMSGPGVEFVACLAETDAGHAAPGIGNIARGAPAVAAHFGAPLPNVPHAVLAKAEDDVPGHLVQCRAHDLVWFEEA